MSGNNSSNYNQQNIPIQQNFDRVLLNVYIDMYNTTLREIDRLYDNLDDIRNSIRTLEINHRNMNLHNNNNRNHTNNYNSNNQSNRRNNNHERTLHGQNHNNQNRIYLNGRYYTIDYIRPNERAQQNRSGLNNIFTSIFSNEVLRNFYDPVIVRPTPQEIQSATMNTTFESISNPINNSCPISLERFESNANVTQITHCGHIFNPTDLSVWFQANVRCPVCRYDIRRYNRRNRSATPPQTSNVQETNQEHSQESSQENIIDEISNDQQATPLLNNSNISNIQYNENGDITFDISGNPLINFATQALTDLLRNNNTRNQTISNILDPSNNNILLFETILRRGT
jgi:hypothetical protein